MPRSFAGLLRRSAAYPREFLGALERRRRIRAFAGSSSEEALAFARTLGIGPTQSDEEILALLERLRAEPPRTVVEIGTDEGGTLFLWTRVAAADALLVALDIRPLGMLGPWSAWALVRRSFARARQRVELLMPVDSHADATLARLRRVLGGRPVDFLFLDGDHSYEGVRDDFAMYSPLVRPGGLVAFHDVAGSGEPEVVRFWHELRETGLTEEWVASSGRQYGIGVYRVPESPVAVAS
jgi:predicted O-methyltransferase YrrM